MWHCKRLARVTCAVCVPGGSITRGAHVAISIITCRDWRVFLSLSPQEKLAVTQPDYIAKEISCFQWKVCLNLQTIEMKCHPDCRLHLPLFRCGNLILLSIQWQLGSLQSTFNCSSCFLKWFDCIGSSRFSRVIVKERERKKTKDWKKKSPCDQDPLYNFIMKPRLASQVATSCDATVCAVETCNPPLKTHPSQYWH